jgi:hypothetical protein
VTTEYSCFTCPTAAEAERAAADFGGAGPEDAEFALLSRLHVSPADPAPDKAHALRAAHLQCRISMETLTQFADFHGRFQFETEQRFRGDPHTLPACQRLCRRAGARAR